MTKRDSNPINRPIAGASRGVTLVELLVVITILTIIFAVMIPRLRAVNEDRNIREAARVVASAFSKASSRAVNDGLSGLMIVPNPNFQQATFDNVGVDGFNAPLFAGTRIFQMRRLPPYIGEEENSLAWHISSRPPNFVVIDKPFEHQQAPEDGDNSNDRLIIQRNDEISFNGSSYRYTITLVGINEDGSKLNLTLDASGPAPLPSLGDARGVDSEGESGVPFVIHRQPRRLESSLVELPEGYLIDLRYSGPLVAADANVSAGAEWNQNPPPEVVEDGDDPAGVVVHFDAGGGVSRIISVGTDGRPQAIQPTGALNCLVTEYDPNAFGPDGNFQSLSDEPIFSPNNKWVSVDHLTGGVHVASVAVPQGPVNLREAILQSQAIATQRQSASQ